MAAAVLAAALPSGAALALDPDKALTQLVLDAWGIEDGLPQRAGNASAPAGGTVDLTGCVVASAMGTPDAR